MGPLAGIRVVELGGIGPGPFGCMMLADMGADIIRIERVKDGYLIGGDRDPKYNIWNRGRRSIRLDLRQPAGVEVAMKLIDQADVVVEGFRPGVAERMGLGPDDCMKRNPRIVYGRMTGWGQEGPLAHAAGHDINYIALAGALHPIGRKDGPPIPPLNLVGDLGGGGLILAFGVVCALVERAGSGKGQVVDAAIVDGVAALMAFSMGTLAAGSWSTERGGNIVDGGVPWYGVYETADGKYVSIGSLEPQFYQTLLERTGLDKESDLPDRRDRARWPELRSRLERLFRSRTRDEWCALLEGSDTCFAPVLALGETVSHPHLVARELYAELGGVTQPRPAPRFSRTNHVLDRPPPVSGEHTDLVLGELGFSPSHIRQLRDQAVVA